ncbi:MAG TPA: hypothetical protein VM100_10670, partial [Longimicrobiales bacterium]|nr:hypothetical protein [Longimicrobiales bacterium]
MKGRPMHDVEQGLPRRLRGLGSSRRHILLTWKFLVPIAVLLLAVALIPARTSVKPIYATLTYSQLVQAIDAGRVASMEIEPGYGVRGHWKTGARTAPDFVVLYTAAEISPLLTRADRAKTSVAFRRAGEIGKTTDWANIGVEVAIVLTLIVALFFLFRQQMGGNRSVGTESSGGDTTFSDV